MKYISTGAAVLVLLLVPFSVAAGAKGTETKNLELSAEGIQKMEIECDAGFLKVAGTEGLSSIRVEAKIDVSVVGSADMDKFIKDHITLTLTKEGEKAVLKSKSDKVISATTTCTIDLTVQVPKNLSLAIADGSGNIEVADLSGDLQIADGSGEINAENIGGKVGISDGSGEISIEKVGASVDVSDGSGDITIADVKGDLSISDGSGDIDVLKVSGNVNVSDGSGDISIDDVGHDVNLESSGSGYESIKNVKGKVNR